jgi:hypothetical protein
VAATTRATVHVTVAPGAPQQQPARRLTYRARQDATRRVWPGRIHPRLKAARLERQEWHDLQDAADRLLAANRWNAASKQLVAEVLAGELATWLEPPA